MNDTCLYTLSGHNKCRSTCIAYDNGACKVVTGKKIQPKPGQWCPYDKRKCPGAMCEWWYETMCIMFEKGDK